MPADLMNLVEYEPRHNPFGYFKRLDPTTAAGAADRTAHLKDCTDFLADIQNGSLPPVAFYKPIRSLTQHPGEADIVSGDATWPIWCASCSPAPAGRTC